MLKQKARTVALAVLVTDLALTAVSLPLTWAFRHGVLTSLMPTVFPLPLYPLNQYMSLVFSNVGNTALTWDTFTGSDLYLADNDEGFAILQGTSAGGRGASSSCLPLQYVILLLTPTPADRWAGEDYSIVWDEISAGNLSNTVDSATCQDNGAAVEWTQRSLTPGGSVTIGTGVSFTGSAVPQGGTVPTLSTLGLAALVLALALVGYLLAGRHSLGA